MSPLPLPVRVAAGLVATVLEKVRKFPGELSDLPVTAASRAVQAGMRVQQRVTELAIKGDEVFALFRPVEDTPPWARFDEDDEPQSPTGSGAARNGAHRTGPRTADHGGLAAVVPGPGAHRPGGIDRRGEIDEAYVARELTPDHPDTGPGEAEPRETEAGKAESREAAPENGETTQTRASARAGAASGAGTPAALPGYDELSLAQLRGRLRGLSLPQLEALLEHEQAQRDRAPFVTMLSNRIITVRSR
jgi:hypothetical protein